MEKKLFVSKDFQIPVELVTQTVGILGIKGSGKTSTGVVFCEELMERGQKVVVADPTGVWHGLRSSAEGTKPGFPIVIFGGDKGDIPLHEEDGEMVATSIVNGKFSAILDFSNFRKGQQTRFMTDVCRDPVSQAGQRSTASALHGG
jgi:DNA helicase HerA-like ATPase